MSITISGFVIIAVRVAEGMVGKRMVTRLKKKKKLFFQSEGACARSKMNFISHTHVNLVSTHLSLGGKSSSERQPG